MNLFLAIGLSLGAIIIAPLLGGILKGFDRRITARMQGRIGPPLAQPFYDFFKLWGKETLTTGKVQLVFALAYLILIIASMVLFCLGQDLLVVLLVFFLGGLCLPLGALSVKSPYSQLGGHRELMQFLAYEPILLLAAVPIALKTGNFLISDIFKYAQPLLPSLWLTFIAIFFVLIIIMRKSPFDISSSEHAHQELVRGILTEYSGKYLALIELTHWIETILVLALIGLFWVGGGLWWLSILIALAAWFAVLVVDNITARLTWSTLLKYAWGFGVLIVAANIIFINLGWM